MPGSRKGHVTHKPLMLFWSAILEEQTAQYICTNCAGHRSVLVILEARSQPQQAVEERCCWIQHRHLPIDR